MTRSPQNGTPAAELDARFAEIRDAQPATAKCVFCPDYHYQGTAAECRKHSAEHRAAEHPSLRPPRRRRNNIRRFQNPDGAWRDEGLRNAAEVSKMIIHREKEAAA